ncbi:MAG TPA: hypothetical protein VM533_14805 [Fimbriiglobus sp.]|jgi:hypothetical protein|nr:hypothetical protein [Fimbriiglobus sp.]
MNGHKRGDHVFNLGLTKTLQDLSALVTVALNLELAGKVAFGAPARADRLRQVLRLLGEGLRNPAFGLTVDKPAQPPGGDANSTAYGEASRQLVLAFKQYLTALRDWHTAAGVSDRRLVSGMLNTACLNLRLAAGRWTDTAVDPEAEALLKVEAPQKAALITVGRSAVEELRQGLVGLAMLYSPLLPPGGWPR